MINSNVNTYKSVTATPKVEDTKSIGDLKDGINKLQNSVNIRLDAIKSSVQRTETTCNDLKCDANTRNTTRDSQIGELRNFSHQIFEAVTDVRNENRRMRDNIAEMEKGISAISESEEYKLISKQRKDNKEKETGCDQTLSKSEIIVSDTEDEDTEITFNKKLSNATDVGETSTITESITNQDTDSTNSCGCSKEQEKISHDSVIDSPNIGPKTMDKALANRKHKVCVIGDSLVGQLNIPLLGKGTQTYVQRLKAPKLQDISKHVAETKDAHLIIIHCGINNLRDNEQTEACVEIMTNTITSLKLAAPNSKILVSKVLPVGDRALNVESSILNAQLEKKLHIEHNDVSFISHLNLSEQDQVIKEYYRNDLLHLSRSGVMIFGKNLHRSIITTLDQTVGRSVDRTGGRDNSGRDNGEGERDDNGQNYGAERRGNNGWNCLDGTERREDNDRNYGVERRDDYGRNNGAGRKNDYGQNNGMERSRDNGRNDRAERRDDNVRNYGAERRNDNRRNYGPGRRVDNERNYSAGRREDDGHNCGMEQREDNGRNYGTERRDDNGRSYGAGRREDDEQYYGVERRGDNGWNYGEERRDDNGRNYGTERRGDNGRSYGAGRREDDEQYYGMERRDDNRRNYEVGGRNDNGRNYDRRR